MSSRAKTAYLTIERMTMEADDAGDSDFADFLRDHIEPFWMRLSPEEKAGLRARRWAEDPAPTITTNWELAMKEARDSAKAASSPEISEAWNAAAGHIAKATGLAASRCPCGRDLINPNYCPFFGDHK